MNVTPFPIGAREKILATPDTAAPADRIMRIAEMLAAAIKVGDLSGIDTLPQVLLEIAADMRGPVVRDGDQSAIDELRVATRLDLSAAREELYRSAHISISTWRE